MSHIEDLYNMKYYTSDHLKCYIYCMYYLNNYKLKLDHMIDRSHILTNKDQGFIKKYKTSLIINFFEANKFSNVIKTIIHDIGTCILNFKQTSILDNEFVPDKFLFRFISHVKENKNVDYFNFFFSKNAICKTIDTNGRNSPLLKLKFYHTSKEWDVHVCSDSKNNSILVDSQLHEYLSTSKENPKNLLEFLKILKQHLNI